MVGKQTKIRLYLNAPLGVAQCVELNRDQANYLFSVMRLSIGDRLTVFNGIDGAWLAEVTNASKRTGQLTALSQTSPQTEPPDIWLLFAPIKKARTDFIVEKAAEMGARQILPVQTDFTNAERIRQDRLQAHAVEAAEQCGGVFVPKVSPLQKLGDALRNWPKDRQIMFCDESLVGARATLTAQANKTKWAILIGPEGGFSPAEQSRLRALDFVSPVSLGPRILRADTAVVAALTLWQLTLGDWQ
ncbi:MAG: 16S rRNA (uracil(1498)-N(3))-methyltransferase [Alphaproteobacteria bacterium]|nr:16S rRNA (uracil(1498)-N(3))-methyltransferase [Alphaproteobacteria bacterium]